LLLKQKTKYFIEHILYEKYCYSIKELRPLRFSNGTKSMIQNSYDEIPVEGISTKKNKKGSFMKNKTSSWL